MKSNDHKDLVNAVLASRDEIDPDLETKLLVSIVDAEIDSAGDGEVAMRAIEDALTVAIDRGVGYIQGSTSSEAAEDSIHGADKDLEDGT